MDETRTTGSSEIVLLRIVATLLALADLAERTRSQPAPVRYLVLWFLRSAESVAREFVVEFASSTNPAGKAAIFHGGSGPHEALRLAVQFRALAAVIDDERFRKEFAAFELCDTATAIPVLARICGLFIKLAHRALAPNATAHRTLASGLPDTS